MAKIDFDKPALCGTCGGPLCVLMPIWIEPGSQYIDTGQIDYESGNPGSSENWFCDSCQERTGFPEPFLTEAAITAILTDSRGTFRMMTQQERETWAAANAGQFENESEALAAFDGFMDSEI